MHSSSGDANCSAFPGLPGGGPDICAARGSLSWETAAAAELGPAPAPELPSVPSEPLELTMDFTGVFNFSAESEPFLGLYYENAYTVGPDDPLALLDNVWFSHLDYTVSSNHGPLDSDGWSLFGDMFSMNDLLGSFLDTGAGCSAAPGCQWLGDLDSGLFFLGEDGLGALAGSPLSDLTAGLASFGTSEFFGAFQGTLSYYTVNDPVNVPEPGTLWLLGAGIAGLLASRRRIRS
ncbi:MAG: PEP-CTERM sorting domain-containing protein [Gammaproteobacteria bacterium]|nr:PEP-CTERM sorting domain-containing protein [Gammaproteobacteria bacterium]